MPTDVFFAVLGAAVMHAAYNAIVKLGDDKIASLAVIAVFECTYGVVGSIIFPMPSAEAWPWLAAAIILQTIYRFLVCYAYRLGDLSQVMPVARGTSPLLVTVGSALLLGEHLSPLSLVAIAIIALGIMTLTLAPTAAGRVDWRAAIVAITSGIVVAGYSMIDGIGSRITGNSGSYIWWLTMCGGLTFLLPALAMRGRTAVSLLKSRWYLGAIGAAFSCTTYWIVVWAMTRAPIGLVSALRETGIIFAVIIGIIWLKEKPGSLRIAAVAITAAGIGLLKLAV